MSGPMDGNPHYANVLDLSARHAKRGDLSSHQAAYDIACQQAEATLALVFEQRTANLIAKLALNAQMSTSNRTLRPDAAKVDDEILARLGLTS